MIGLIQLDWTSVLKIYGPLGLFCLVTGLLIWKGLLPYIRKQHEEQIKALQSTVEDARRERDAARRLRERETERFLESLRLRDEKMERGFSEIIVALHRRSRD